MTVKKDAESRSPLLVFGLASMKESSGRKLKTQMEMEVRVMWP